MTDCLNATLSSSWDFERNDLNHYNLALAYTFNEDFAIATELRHRSAFAWRKVDEENFIMENFHTEPALLASSVSDRRNTILSHVFYRFCPTWALELRTRASYHRRNEPELLEYQIDLHGTLRGSWKVRVSLQHRENDDRVALNISMGDQPPKDCVCPTVRMARGNY